MLVTNKIMLILLAIIIGLHIFAIVFNSLFYFKIIGPNSNREVKDWFFNQVQSNMNSRAIDSITLSSSSECVFPQLNLFHYGYPLADKIKRFCMCNEDKIYPEIDIAGNVDSAKSPQNVKSTCKSCHLF